MSFRNYYELLPEKFKSKIDSYKSYPRVKINTPFRMLIVGTSGSKKTNAFMNILTQINNFTRVFIYAKEINEPLYANLIDIYTKLGERWGRTIITYSNNIRDVPNVDEFDKNEKNLVIFDDLVNENAKTLKPVSEIFTRGRKRNISSVFISQTYFGTPMIIRQNVNYVMLKKITGKADLSRILKQQGMDADINLVLKMYKFVQEQDSNNIFLIDGLTTDERLKFRMNFSAIVY